MAVDARILRDWALRLLGEGEAPSDALWTEVAACDPRSWSVFLALEGCALAVQNRVQALDAWALLTPAARSSLKLHAQEELFRVLSARAQIRTIARLADEHGWTAMLLKGGAAIAEGEMIDLSDVDILVAPEHAADLAASLDALGFVPTGAEPSSHHHLAGRTHPDALTIEVHRRTKNDGELARFLPNAVALPSAAPLIRMGAADNVRYLIQHASVQHPERIGRLRDLLLIAHSLRRCSAGEIEEIERECAASSSIAQRMLRAARGFSGGRSEQTPDPFRRLALRRYIVFHRFGHLSTTDAGLAIFSKTLRLLGEGRSRWWGAYLDLYRIPANAVPPIRVVRWLHARSKLLGNVAWRISRHISFGSASAIALSAEVEARWIEARWIKARANRS